MPSQSSARANAVGPQLQEALRVHDLLGRRVVAAVSGGADSLALLFGLHELAVAGEIEVQVGHFDHGLRPESIEDALFVSQVAEELNLPYHAGAAPVAEIARRERRGIEETARRERYRFLGEVARSVEAAAVVTGHTSDDQLETRLLHLVRGTGLGGLVGMVTDSNLAWPDITPIRVVRPLLGVSRASTEAYCQARGIGPRQDPSNNDLTFTRNRLRHEVIPVLIALNPRFADGLERLACLAQDADDYLESELSRHLPSLVTERDGAWIVDRAAWRALPLALKRGLLRRGASAVAADAEPIEAVHVEAALSAADSAPAGTTLTWPGGRELRLWHDEVVIAKTSHQPVELTEQAVRMGDGPPINLGSIAPALFKNHPVAGVGSEGLVTLTLHQQDLRCRSEELDRWHVDFDLDRLTEAAPLVLRGRRPGDRLAPAGIVGTKKVQDLLIDAHVPREQREHVPILAGVTGPIWAIGLRPDRRYLADAHCRRVVCATIGIDRDVQSSSTKETVWSTT